MLSTIPYVKTIYYAQLGNQLVIPIGFRKKGGTAGTVGTANKNRRLQKTRLVQANWSIAAPYMSEIRTAHFNYLAHAMTFVSELKKRAIPRGLDISSVYIVACRKQYLPA